MKDRSYLKNRIGCIYIIKNFINDKVYIGQTTKDVDERYKRHLRDKHNNNPLYKDMEKYGVENFYYEILEDNIPYSELDYKEMYYIEKYDSYNNGYNLTTGGIGCRVLYLSELNKIKEMIEGGYTYKEIRKKFNISNNVITNIKLKYNLNYKAMIKHPIVEMRKYTKEIIEYYNKGLSNKEIGKIFNVDKDLIGKILIENNIKREREWLKNRNNFNYYELIHDYYKGMDLTELYKKYNISRSTFYRIKSKYYVVNRNP